jgi:hypothetical protein
LQEWIIKARRALLHQILDGDNTSISSVIDREQVR